jgi:hypothetical protein
VNINPEHFRLLRLAKLRQLKVRRLGEGVYAVSSHSRPGHFHKVAGGACSCEATSDWCTHRALAFDRQMMDSDSASERLDYVSAQREDFTELLRRQLRRELTAEDRRYVRPHVERVRARYEEAEKPAGDYACTF